MTESKTLNDLGSNAGLAMTIEQIAMAAAHRAGIAPNDMVRFLVDYGNGIDGVAPCAAVMTFCEHFAALVMANGSGKPTTEAAKPL